MIIETERLIPRAIDPQRDFEPWAKAMADEASVEYVFTHLRWPQVIHVILEGNGPSIALATRIGSSLIGEQQGVPGVTDQRVFIYGQAADGGPARL